MGRRGSLFMLMGSMSGERDRRTEGSCKDEIDYAKAAFYRIVVETVRSINPPPILQKELTAKAMRST
jgi:hypothetical protein